MNRREFLLAIGATACSGRTTPLETPIETAKPDAAKPRVIVDEHTSVTRTNLDASPLAIHADVLVHGNSDELSVWDVTTMRRSAAFSLPHDAFTLLADGSIVAFGKRAAEHDCAVYRIANGALSTYPTWLCGTAPTLLLRTGNVDSVYSVRDKEIVRFRFDGSKVEADATIEIPFRGQSNYDQVFSLDDGRVVVPGDGISILAPGATAVRRPMPKILPRHLARATGERFWYTRGQTIVDTLVLASLDAPQRDVRAVTFAPSRIVHVASHGSAIAVLLMSPPAKEDTWFVAVVDEAGTERWRAQVPRQPRPYDLNASAVALSDKRLVLGTPSGVLLAWNAATGASVAVTPPA